LRLRGHEDAVRTAADNELGNALAGSSQAVRCVQEFFHNNAGFHPVRGPLLSITRF
jgi:hypothetical protein